MTLSYHDYNPGHPWFYYLGGPVQKPSLIRERVRTNGLTGYLQQEIAALDQKPEPKRSEGLRALRANVMRDACKDLSIYRRVVRELRDHRRSENKDASKNGCADVHSSMSLKVNHLTNDFAHLLEIDRLLSTQGDLFAYVIA